MAYYIKCENEVPIEINCEKQIRREKNIGLYCNIYFFRFCPKMGQTWSNKWVIFSICVPWAGLGQKWANLGPQSGPNGSKNCQKIAKNGPQILQKCSPKRLAKQKGAKNTETRNRATSQWKSLFFRSHLVPKQVQNEAKCVPRDLRKRCPKNDPKIIQKCLQNASQKGQK